MSIDTNVAVMSAKLKGDTNALQTLAAQGNMSAFLALKDLLERTQARNAATDMATSNAPEKPSVLAQVSQALLEEAPPAGLAAAYAEGGAVEDGDGYLPGEGITGRLGRRLRSILRALQPDPSKFTYAGGPPPTAAEPTRAGRTYDTGSQEYQSPVSDTDSAAPVALARRASALQPGKLPPGIAGVAGPEPVAAAAPQASAPQAAAPNADYAAFRDELKGLSAEEKAARLATAEAGKTNLAETEKRLQGGKYDPLFKFFSHLSQQKTSDPLAALGGASNAFQKEQEQKKIELETLQNLRRTQTAATNMANIAAAKGDAVSMYEHAQKADEARRKADDLAGKLKLEAAQTAHAQGQADVVAKDAESRRIAANAAMKGATARETKASAVGAAKGPKPMTEAEQARWVGAKAKELVNNAAKDLTGVPMTQAAAMREARRLLADQRSGEPDSPAVPSGAGEWGIRKLQ